MLNKKPSFALASLIAVLTASSAFATDPTPEYSRACHNYVDNIKNVVTREIHEQLEVQAAFARADALIFDFLAQLQTDQSEEGVRTRGLLDDYRRTNRQGRRISNEDAQALVAALSNFASSKGFVRVLSRTECPTAQPHVSAKTLEGINTHYKTVSATNNEQAGGFQAFASGVAPLSQRICSEKADDSAAPETLAAPVKSASLDIHYEAANPRGTRGRLVIQSQALVPFTSISVAHRTHTLQVQSPTIVTVSKYTFAPDRPQHQLDLSKFFGPEFDNNMSQTIRTFAPNMCRDLAAARRERAARREAAATRREARR